MGPEAEVDDWCKECQARFVSISIHNDFFHKPEDVGITDVEPTVEQIVEGESNWTISYCLLAEIKHSNGNGTWFRVFGPFDTRHKAVGMRKRMVRKYIQEDYRSLQWVKDNVKFRTTTLWTPVK